MKQEPIPKVAQDASKYLLRRLRRLEAHDFLHCAFLLSFSKGYEVPSFGRSEFFRQRSADLRCRPVQEVLKVLNECIDGRSVRLRGFKTQTLVQQGDVALCCLCSEGVVGDEYVSTGEVSRNLISLLVRNRHKRYWRLLMSRPAISPPTVFRDWFTDFREKCTFTAKPPAIAPTMNETISLMYSTLLPGTPFCSAGMLRDRVFLVHW